MAGKPGSKMKILAVLDILWNYSDENNILSAADICDKLEEFDILAERKSIYADINCLVKFGFDIVSCKSPKKGYFLGSRRFEIAEVRLLLDAVKAANFISSKKATELHEKLYALLSREQAEKIKEHCSSIVSTKSENEELYYTVDAINTAVLKKKKIKFEYYKRRLTKRMTTSGEIKSFIVSPYALVWANDRYYLVSNNEKYDNLMHTRLDRMSKVEVLEDAAARDFSEVSPYEGSFDANDYAQKHLNMFSGQLETVEPSCSMDLLDEILDQFGSKAPLKSDGEDRFIIRINTALSEGFYGWVLRFGGKVKIHLPQHVADNVKAMALNMVSQYD